MNTVPNYTLAARPQSGRMLRGWAVLSRGTFSGAIFLLDVALIVAMSCATGITYCLFAYGDRGNITAFLQVGVLAAAIFGLTGGYRGEYRLPNFFTFKPRGRRTIQLWNVTLICLLMVGFLTQISAQYSRAWIVLFYVTTLGALIVERFLIVRLIARARAAGIISAQRIFLIGTGAQVGSFINYYEPWVLGINIVGCRFLTPVSANATEAERRAALDRDLSAAATSVRGIEPDAIFLLLPWSATETIDRCAAAFLALPVEIHLGPEQILHKFEDVELSKHGPLASLQLNRMPLSRLEVVQKRLLDLVIAAAALIALTPLLIIVAALIRLDSRGPVFSCSAATASTSNSSASSNSAPCERSTTVQWCRRRYATIRGSPGWDAGCGGGTSTSFRSSSMCSRAICHWSARARMRWRTIATMSGASRSTRAGTTSSRASPAGRRSTAFAA